LHGSDHALSGTVDSSAAFGVGMTRPREQGDAKNLSANCKTVSVNFYWLAVSPATQ
jgi:hypothetical protein